MATNRVLETNEAKSMRAYVVLNHKGEQVAKVLAHYGRRVHFVNVFSYGHDAREMQSARAGGYGYDKFTSALSGMMIDGHKMTDHCSTDGAPKPPRGSTLYPDGSKPKKGYMFTNWTRRSKSTGQKWSKYDWHMEAEKMLGVDASFDDIANRARDLREGWEASDDCESGYASCFRLDGLHYLEALGYRVIQVL